MDTLLSPYIISYYSSAFTSNQFHNHDAEVYAIYHFVSFVFGLLTTRDAKDFVNTKSQARKKQLLTGHLHTVVVYALSELIFGFYHAFERSVIIMLCLLIVVLSVNRFVNEAVVYHGRV